VRVAKLRRVSARRRGRTQPAPVCAEERIEQLDDGQGQLPPDQEDDHEQQKPMWARVNVKSIPRKKDFPTRPLIIKEVKLPVSSQTHELAYDPATKAVYVSQMPESILTRVKLQFADYEDGHEDSLSFQVDGLLGSSSTSWMIGRRNPYRPNKGISGLHNVSLNPEQDGTLWVSLQFQNVLLLLDVRSCDDDDDFDAKPTVLREIHVPTTLFSPTFPYDEARAMGSDSTETGPPHHPHQTKVIGGPHCIRVAPNGELWVCLKGDVGCDPSGKRNAVCCSSEEIKNNMNLLDEPFPNAYAIFRFNLPEFEEDWKKRNPGKPVPLTIDCRCDDLGQGKFCTVYESMKSPTMLDFVDSETDGALPNVVAVQDDNPFVMFIDSSLPVANLLDSEAVSNSLDEWTDQFVDPLEAVTQIRLPVPFGDSSMITGPGAVQAPDRQSVWFTSLKADGLIGRVMKNKKVEMFRLPVLGYTQQSTIHMAFSVMKAGEDCPHEAFIICSDLLQRGRAINALVKVEFDETVGGGWDRIASYRHVPLPTQMSEIHRVLYLSFLEQQHRQESTERRSVIITELGSSKMCQILVNNLLKDTAVTSSKTKASTLSFTPGTTEVDTTTLDEIARQEGRLN